MTLPCNKESQKKSNTPFRLKKIFSTISLPLSVATAIALLVVLSGFFVIFNLKFMGVDWRNTFIQFQTFFSVLTVLAASLFTYCASTSMTKEVRRKNAEDQINLRQNILSKATLTVEMVRAESNAALHQLHQFSGEYILTEIPIRQYKKLSITMPQQLFEMMNNLSCLPEDIYVKLSHLILYVQKYTLIHHENINDYSEGLKRVKEMDAMFKEYIKSDGFDYAQKEWADKFIEKQDALREELSNIKWRQSGNILENINGLALTILESLPLSEEWKIHDQVPYPSGFIQNDAG